MPDATDLHERVQSAPRAETVPQIDFAYVFSALRKRIVLVAAITLLFMIGSIALSMLMTNYYTASTSILVDPEGSRIVEGEINSGTTATEARALNQQFILTSERFSPRLSKAKALPMIRNSARRNLSNWTPANVPKKPWNHSDGQRRRR